MNPCPSSCRALATDLKEAAALASDGSPFNSFVPSAVGTFSVSSLNWLEFHLEWPATPYPASHQPLPTENCKILAGFLAFGSALLIYDKALHIEYSYHLLPPVYGCVSVISSF